ncbi:MAG: hypothetical protein ACYCT7_04215 [bacterium]
MLKIKEFWEKYEDNKYFKITIVSIGIILAWLSQYLPVGIIHNIK